MSGALSRTVWYCHGFDPATPARYRRIFEAAAGPQVQTTDLPGQDGWRARRGPVEILYRHLRYDDLIRAYRSPGLWRRLARAGRALIGDLMSGTGYRLCRAAPRTALLALSPALCLIVPAVVVAGLIPGPLRLPAAVATCALCGWLMRRVFLDVVADLFAFQRALARGDPAVSPAYEARIDAFARAICAAPGGGETLVVGHSLGGITAILTLAATLAHWPAGQPIHLLTLGSTHGVVLSARGPGQQRLASAIQRIAADPRVFWVDVSSPRDAFCVPLTDPRVLIGRGPAAPNLRIIAAQLRDAPAIPGDRRTVFTAMRRHMGYLLRAPGDAGFDHVETVTGPSDLRQRFGPRANSPRARMWRA